MAIRYTQSFFLAGGEHDGQHKGSNETCRNNTDGIRSNVFSGRYIINTNVSKSTYHYRNGSGINDSGAGLDPGNIAGNHGGILRVPHL